MNHRYAVRLASRSISLLAALTVAGAEKPAAAQRPGEAKSETPPTTPATQDPKKEREVASKWDMSIYGFLEFDGMSDSTQSFGDSQGNTPILRSDNSRPAYLPVGTNPLMAPMYGASHSRLQATARNTRIGFKISPPDVAGVKFTGVLELDFFGNQPATSFSSQDNGGSATSEGSFLTSATFRLRHAYAKIETGVVDVLFGQYYNLFGWQPYFFPATLSFLGTPNMIFGRTPQVRVSKTLKTGPVNVELAGALTRPTQRDSGFPGLEGGIRFDINQWRGPHGRGSGQPTIDAASIGLTGTSRKFRVIEYVNNRGDVTQGTAAAEASGVGFSVDAMVPIVPSRDLETNPVALTLTGSYVQGQGIADLYTGGLTGGVVFPLPEGPGGPFTGVYAGNIDPGLVQYDSNGILRVIHWKSAMVGFQLYLPPAGRVVLAGNYTRAESDNVEQSIAEGGDPARTFRIAQYYDANLFVDFTGAIRGGLSYQHTKQTYGLSDGSEGAGDEKNDRFEIGGLLFF